MITPTIAHHVEARYVPVLALTVQQVAGCFGVEAQTIERMVTEGTFPPPFYMGRLKRWQMADVERFVTGEWKPEGASDAAQAVHEATSEVQCKPEGAQAVHEASTEAHHV